MDNNAQPLLFSYSFKLRKSCPQFRNLMNVIENLQSRGFHVQFSLAPDNKRWLQIIAFERVSAHPTVAVNRMLADSNSLKLKEALSAFNFGLVFHCGLKFEIADDDQSFEVKLYAPPKPMELSVVLSQLQLLGLI